MSDKTLASLTAATPATGGLFYGTQSGADRKFTLSGAGAALVEAASAGDQRTALGLGAISTQAGKSAFIAGGTNANVLASTGYEVTGGEVTSALDISGTWNTTGAPTAIKVDVTDTASNASSLLFDLRRNGSTAVSFDKNGALKWGAVGSVGRVPVFFSRGQYGDVIWYQGGGNNVIIGNPINFECAYITLNTYGASGNGGVMLQGFQMQPNVLQIGNNDPTTPTAQTIKAHDVTTGTGAALMLSGGKGSVAGGAVILGTSTALGGPAARLTVASSGNTTFAQDANTQGVTINGAVSGAGATRSLVSINDVWTNNSGLTAPRLLDLNLTDSGISGGTIDYSSTQMIRCRRNGSDVFSVDHGGGIAVAGSGCFIDPNNAKLQIASSWNYNVNGDTWLGRGGAAVWRVGLDHASTATAQTIKAHDVTTGTGAALILTGGKGSGAGGAVILGTSATNGAAVARLTIKASGVINVAGIPTSAAGLSAGDLYSNGGVLTVV